MYLSKKKRHFFHTLFAIKVFLFLKMDDPMNVDQVPDKDDIDTDRDPKKRKTSSSANAVDPRKGKKINTVKISNTKKCKLSTLLNVRYKPLKNIFRIVAEIHSVTRRDALNFALLMVCQWMESGGNDQKWPEITTKKFWSHCYRAVMPDYHNLNKVKYEDVIINSIDAFNLCRINPETNTLLYQIPPFDRLQGYIANDYCTAIVTNVKLHARNSVKSYLRRVFKGFLRGYKEHHAIDELQYGKIASTLFESIIKHAAVSDEIFSAIPGPNDQVKSFYFTIRGEYIKTFGSAEYDDLIDFDKVDIHVKELIYFSGYLLHVVDTFNINVRKWTLLPIASHQIVHVKLSGFSIIYHFLAIAFRCGICIPPQFLKTYDNIMSKLECKFLSQSRSEYQWVAEWEK
ncbi:hypothetical protein K501DRAFT_315024 [Backusella circina FSU 941]|nr:hypothetical protein K501DRAFT_315024 [Backusella circina FSU 941]